MKTWFYILSLVESTCKILVYFNDILYINRKFQIGFHYFWWRENSSLLTKVITRLCSTVCSDKGCSFADEQPSRKKRNGQYPADDIEMPVFSTEVVILDRNKKCHVSSGDYEFVLHEQGADFKNASWETVMNGKVNSSAENIIHRYIYTTRSIR